MINRLITKYKKRIAEFQKKKELYDALGRAEMCANITGAIQAYDAIISDLGSVSFYSEMNSNQVKERLVHLIGDGSTGSGAIVCLYDPNVGFMPEKDYQPICILPETNDPPPAHAILNKSAEQIIDIIGEHCPTKGNDKMVCLRGMYDDILRVPRWRAKIIMEHNPIYTFTSKKVYKRVQRNKR